MVLGRSLLAAVIACLPAAAAAQSDGQDGPIQIRLERENYDIGLEGYVREGTWAPLRLTVRNATRQLRTVAVEWIVHDVDGDVILARRSPVGLTPEGDTLVRLFAVPPTNRSPKEGWRVRVVDLEDEQVLTSAHIVPPRVVDERDGVIGVTGGGLLGLEKFLKPVMQHEGVEVIGSLYPKYLPNKWYGLSLLDTLIWTREGGDPNAAGVPLDAVREWVKRGGHLVVSLSAVDVAWSDPRLADLLPPVRIAPAKRIDIPGWLIGGDVHRANNKELDARVFELLPQKQRQRDIAVLLRSRPQLLDENAGAGEPLVVASQYGLGRVTLIGLDLTSDRFKGLDKDDTPLREKGLPLLWRTAFGWRAPVDELNPAKLANDDRLISEMARDTVPLGEFIPGRIAMKGAAGVTLLVAVLLFAAYWLAAGPVMFAFLKARGLAQHAWVAFAAVVVAFSFLTWSGATLMRQRSVEVEHFSVIDIDAASGHVRTQSWFSIYIPHHGRADITIDRGYDDGANENTLVSAGLPGADKGEFLDEQRYAIDVTEPGALAGVPVRSTAKQFEAKYTDRIAASPLTEKWPKPTGKLRIVAGWPQGDLTHHLPGDLTNVVIVYCPGGDQVPLVMIYKQQRRWESGAAFRLRQPIVGESWNLVSVPKGMGQAKSKGKTGYEDRRWRDEGILGQRFAEQYAGRWSEPDSPEPVIKVPKTDEMVAAIEVLSFYSFMPPPDFVVDEDGRMNMLGGDSVHLTRAALRGLDLSHLAALRRVIIIGHIERGAALPLPLKVDGQTPDATGWATVRFILPIDE